MRGNEEISSRNPDFFEALRRASQEIAPLHSHLKHLKSIEMEFLALDVENRGGINWEALPNIRDEVSQSLPKQCLAFGVGTLEYN